MTDWRDSAACLGHNTDIFFSEETNRRSGWPTRICPPCAGLPLSEQDMLWFPGGTWLEP